MNKIRANKSQLPYDDHERALKLVHALDRRVWEIKVAAIIESPNYETLTVDELFSKLKSTEIDLQSRAKVENPSAPTMALSPDLEDLMLTPHLLWLADDELALAISRFQRFHGNRKNCRRGGLSCFSPMLGTVSPFSPTCHVS